MKSKLKKILLGLAVITIIPTKVYCAEVSMEHVYKIPSGVTTDLGLYRIKKSSRDSEQNYDFMPKIIIKDGGNNHIGYCIDVEENLKSGDSISPYNQTLEQYLSSKNISNANQIAKKINEYIYYGYKTTDVTAKENGEYYAATQQLIWETLSNAGYRSAEYNTVIPFRISGNESTIVDLTKEKNEIISKINNHYKTPSFCSSNEKLELAVGETATYTDNNGVLSNYNVECSEGIKCEKDGNNLKVSILSDSGEQNIAFTKNGDGVGTTLYKEGNNQAVVINEGKIEPVSCSFGVDTYKNVQTSGIKIVTIISIGMLFGLTAYLIYYKKENLNN